MKYHFRNKEVRKLKKTHAIGVKIDKFLKIVSEFLYKLLHFMFQLSIKHT